MERMKLTAQIPHVGPRCSYCGCKPDGEHSQRCGVRRHGFDPHWDEWPDDIKAERDALRRLANRLATEGTDDA